MAVTQVFAGIPVVDQERRHRSHCARAGDRCVHDPRHSKRETLPVEFSLSGATLEAAGSLTFPWSEFDMIAPSIGGFVNVTGKATMEFDLCPEHA